MAIWTKCRRCGATGRIQWQDEQRRTRQECARCEIEDIDHYVHLYGELPPGVQPQPVHAIDLLTYRP